MPQFFIARLNSFHLDDEFFEVSLADRTDSIDFDPFFDTVGMEVVAKGESTNRYFR